MKITGLWKRGNVYWYRVMRHGERRVFNLRTSDLSEAIQKAAAIKSSAQVEPADLVSRELFKALQVKVDRKVIREKTRRNMASVIDQFVAFAGPVSLATITQDCANRFLAHLREKNMSEHSVQAYARQLRSLWTLIVHTRPELSNPFAGLSFPRLPRSPRRDFCTVEQRDRLIDAADGDLRLILMLGFLAGLRRREISEARPDWIDLGQKVIHVSRTATYVPKDSDDRTIPLAGRLVDHFREHGVRSPFLVEPGVKHRKSEYRYNFRMPFEKLVRGEGLAWVTPHTMRRTFASLLVQRGVSIFKVARWLGDDVRVVQESYGHLMAYDEEIG